MNMQDRASCRGLHANGRGIAASRLQNRLTQSIRQHIHVQQEL